MKITIYVEHDDGSYSKNTLNDVPEDVTEDAFGKAVHEVTWRAYESVINHREKTEAASVPLAAGLAESED